MARLVFSMNMSLDGYVDHDAFMPGPKLFRHFIELTKGLAGSLYGSRIYGLMRYWEGDNPDWDPAEREFALAWQAQPVFVASKSLTEVGPNATLLGPDLESEVRRLKSGIDGEIDVAGTQIAKSLSALGLIDEYRIYLHPVVLGAGTPFFAAAVPRLKFLSSERVDDDVLRLAYVPE